MLGEGGSKTVKTIMSDSIKAQTSPEVDIHSDGDARHAEYVEKDLDKTSSSTTDPESANPAGATPTATRGIIKREELPRGGLANDEIEPTEAELSTLRRVADYFPTAAYFVVIVELCERFGYYGINAPLQNYISYPKEGHPTNGQPGAIGLGQQGATGLTNCMRACTIIASNVIH